MLTFRFGAVAIAALALTLPTRVQAQAGAEAVPSDVVRAILRNVDARTDVSAIHVGGRLPDTLQSRIALPPGARLISSLVGSPSYIIGTVQGDPDSVRLWFAGEFERRGYQPVSWSRRPPPFRPADRSPTNSGYCDGDSHISVSAARWMVDSVEFVVRVRRSPECAMTSDHVSLMRDSHGYVSYTTSGERPSELPLLYHPLSAEVTPECAAERRPRFRGEANVTTSISTSARPEAVLAHYGLQLDTLGWERDTLFTGTFGSWTKQDSTGRSVRTILSVKSAAGARDCRELHMNVREDPQ